MSKLKLSLTHLSAQYYPDSQNYKTIIDAIRRIEELEKQRISVASYNALKEECDGRMEAIKNLQTRIKELEKVIHYLRGK